MKWIKQFVKNLFITILSAVFIFGLVMCLTFPIFISLAENNWWFLLLYFVSPVVTIMYLWVGSILLNTFTQ